MLHIAFVFFLFVIGIAAWLTASLRKLIGSGKLLLINAEEISEELETTKNVFLWGIPFSIVSYGLYLLVGHLKWEAHVLDWLNLLIRWFHVVIGIAWIGASFYFIFLENSLNRTESLRDELAGNLWAVHGGGFYYLEKYKTAPKQIPKTLHWFKYEAYFTWL